LKGDTVKVNKTKGLDTSYAFQYSLSQSRTFGDADAKTPLAAAAPIPFLKIQMLKKKLVARGIT
jgi:hypothetical protein